MIDYSIDDEHYVDDNLPTALMCSHCNTIFSIVPNKSSDLPDTDYCPVCGEYWSKYAADCVGAFRDNAANWYVKIEYCENCIHCNDSPHCKDELILPERMRLPVNQPCSSYKYKNWHEEKLDDSELNIEIIEVDQK